jgi:DNA polymerase III delta prime subunit
MIRPHAVHRALAYVATGSMPPLMLRRLMPRAASTLACLALGLLIGNGIAP